MEDLVGSEGLTSYLFEVSISKSAAGDKPTLTPGISQMPPLARSLHTLTSKDVEYQNFIRTLSSFVVNGEVYWALNSNPFVRIALGPTADKFISFVDYPGFLKNNVIGIRLSKVSLNQTSPWIYGVIQYPVPRFNGPDRSIVIDGHGLLYEAGRRTTSRAFRNTTAKAIISDIVQKYGLTLETKGDLNDHVIRESDQNVDDTSYLNMMAMLLDAFWYMRGNTVILTSRQFSYSQTPILSLRAVPPTDVKAFKNWLPLIDFVPEFSDDAFEAGADRLTARGIDLDTKQVVEKVFTPQLTRLGTMSLNDDNFLSDSGVVINGITVVPAPRFRSYESGIFLPLKTRSDDLLRYQALVEQKDVEIRVTARVPGAPLLEPSNVVSVQGVGGFFSGNYVVESVYHRFNRNEGFVTDLLLMRNAIGYFSSESDFGVNIKPVSSVNTPGKMVEAEPIGPRE